MDITEINEKTNFNTWEDEKINELKKGIFVNTLGNFLFENDSIRLWDLSLLPKERIPFGRRKSNYSLTCMTNGLAISRKSNGEIDLIRLKKGDTPIWLYEENEIICDFENIGETLLKFIVIEHKPAAFGIKSNL
ncbi:MAG: hypothetical protein ABJN95_06370 [Maribacter sp.]|uniref:hypothetical protein n=1 Tax=Maribacter sp. TaxID=1897614 RepID=UPI00329A78AB